MNIERGFARAIKALNRFSLLWMLFCFIKIIQYFPSNDDGEWLIQRMDYWKSVQVTCPKSWNCYSMVMGGATKDLFSIFSSVAEWVAICIFTLVAIDALVHILRGFLDDEGLFADE
jgi:hypothetical protein